jgi:hypothetical protein
MVMISSSATFSAEVRLHLFVGDQKYEIGSLGPGFGYLRVPQEITEHQVELETIVDGKSTRWPVHLTTPITPASRRFTFEAV